MFKALGFLGAATNTQLLKNNTKLDCKVIIVVNSKKFECTLQPNENKKLDVKREELGEITANANIIFSNNSIIDFKFRVDPNDCTDNVEINEDHVIYNGSKRGNFTKSSKFDEKEKEVQSLKQENQLLSQEIQNLTQKLNTINNSYEELTLNHKNSTTIITTLDTKYNNLLIDYKTLSEKNIKDQDLIASYETKYSEQLKINSQNIESKKLNDEQIKKCGEQIKKYNDQLNLQNAQNKKLNDEKVIMEKQCNDIVKLNDENTQIIKANNEKIASLNSQIASLSEQIKILSQNVEIVQKLQAEKYNDELKYSKLLIENNEQSKTITLIQSKYDELSKNISSYNSLLNEINNISNKYKLI